MKIFFITIYSLVSVVFLHAQTLDWAKSFGGVGGDVSNSITVDSDGNVLVAGSFNGTADFDPTDAQALLTAVGSNDIFLAKYDSLGNYIWAKNFGGTEFESAFSVITDADNNIYITGSFVGTVDFDASPAIQNITSNGQADAFLSKYDSDGNFLWANNIGGTAFDGGQDLAVDNEGNIIVVGDFQGSVNFELVGTNMLTSAGASDGFFAKYNANGEHIFSKQVGGFGAEGVQRIALDSQGRIYISGIFQQEADFNPSVLAEDNLTAQGSGDAFFAKYNSDGIYIWAKRIGSTGSEGISGLAVDATGNPYITGYYFGKIDLDASADSVIFNSIGQQDNYVAEYDTDGNYVWSSNIPGSNNSESIGISVGAGNVYITGYFRNSVDFGISTLTSAGENDLFLATYNNSGICIAAKQMGGADDSYVHAITIKNNYLYLTGYFLGTIDLDPSVSTENFTSQAFSDGYMARYKTTELTAGIETFGTTETISVFPNPSSSYITVQSSTAVKVELYTITGILIECSLAKEIHQINISEYATGTYVLKSGANTVKIMKQ